MEIAVVGTGYLALVTASCFAEMGVNVMCVDLNQRKIDSLLHGEIPIYESGLYEIVFRNHKEGRLLFATDLASCLDKVEIVFSALDTPVGDGDFTDLKSVQEMAYTIGRYMNKYLAIVMKSTVSIGAAQIVKAAIQKRLSRRGVNIAFDIVSNPDFLKEGTAIKDFISPDIVVVGVDSDRAKELMAQLYRPMILNNFHVIFTDILTAEMIKYAVNSMLATRICFMNDIANLCELVGANVDMVRKGIGMDSRIGSKYLYSGCGYGGNTFSKDVKELIKTAEKNSYNMRLLKAVEEVNENQKSILFYRLSNYYNGTLKGKTVTLWGLSFKPETDDICEATSLILIQKLVEVGCKVCVYDPLAMDECRRRIGNKVGYAANMYDATLNSDALLLVTEWKQFFLPSWGVVKKLMNQAVVIDGRNIYNEQELTHWGFDYLCIGK